MKRYVINVSILTLLVLSALLLLACGGGGGSGGNTPSGGNSATPTPTPIPYSKAMLISDFADQLAGAYNDTNTSFSALSTAASAYCADTANSNLFNDFKNAWLDANNDWQYVQGINFGPANTDNRRFNIAIYPNDPVRLDERISTLINGSETISQTLVSQLSADLQGLTAVERLLFKDSAFELFTISTDVERNCLYAVAVAENLHALIHPIYTDWQSSGSYYQSFTSSSNTEQALEDWFGAAVEYLQVIRDSKLLQASVGNTRFIEAPLAQVSLENIQRNIEFLNDANNLSATTGLSTYLESEELDLIESRFQARLDDSLTLLQNSSSLSALAQADGGPESIEEISQGVHSVLEYFATTLAETINVFVGFNGADGD